MSLVLKQKSGGGSIEPIEEGAHLAVCVGIIDIGEQYDERYKKWSRKVYLQFEITDEQITVDGKTVNRIMTSRAYKFSLHESSALRKALDAWRGRPFTPDELDGFDLKKIIGVPCQLFVTHSERDGKTYANISGISKVKKGVEIKQTLPPFVFDLDEDPLDMLDEIPEWIVNKIKESRTYQERVAGRADDDGLEYEEAPALVDITEDAGGELPF